MRVRGLRGGTIGDGALAKRPPFDTFEPIRSSPARVEPGRLRLPIRIRPGRGDLRPGKAGVATNARGISNSFPRESAYQNLCQLCVCRAFMSP